MFRNSRKIARACFIREQFEHGINLQCTAIDGKLSSFGQSQRIDFLSHIIKPVTPDGKFTTFMIMWPCEILRPSQ